MTASHCGKRSRSSDDSCDDCLPISKRINRLHIRLDRPASAELSCHQLFTSAEGESNQVALGATSDESLAHRFMHQHGGGVLSPSSSAATDVVDQTSVVTFKPPPDCCQLLPLEQHHQPMEEYQPDLDARHNPHYYHVNELLFSANLARLKRGRDLLPS